jgi:hypothetical protein
VTVNPLATCELSAFIVHIVRLRTASVRRACVKAWMWNYPKHTLIYVFYFDPFYPQYKIYINKWVEIIRNHKLKKDRQYNGQKKKDKSTDVCACTYITLPHFQSYAIYLSICLYILSWGLDLEDTDTFVLSWKYWLQYRYRRRLE